MHCPLPEGKAKKLIHHSGYHMHSDGGYDFQRIHLSNLPDQNNKTVVSHTNSSDLDNKEMVYSSCKDAYEQGERTSGVYTLKPYHMQLASFKVTKNILHESIYHMILCLDLLNETKD